MAGQDRIRQSNVDTPEIETPLDTMIRASFYNETRRRLSDPGQAWARLLQRAQSEVTQLPAADARTDASVGSAVFSEAKAELQADHRPIVTPLLQVGDVDTTRLVTPTFTNQINHYRHAMQMKMWRTVGALGLSMGTI